MPPPPNNPPGDDDPFGGLDPMAWLEALAKRQGANVDELMTGGGAELPPPPPSDSVTTGPGYTPYDTGSSKPPPLAARPIAPPPAPEHVTAVSADDPFGGLDPMAWLEALAKRQGANPDELLTGGNAEVAYAPEGSVDNSPGYTPGYDVGPSGKATAAAQPEVPRPQPVKAEPKIAPPAPPAPPPPAPIPEPVAAASADDPFGGLDPMAWLEALAKRQGANPDELLTGGNAEVAYAPEGSVDNSPGYTPGYDVGPSGKATAAAQPEVRKPEPVKVEPKIAPPPAPPPLAPVVAAPVAAASADDPFGGLDPMAWLDALAKRQGANPDELLTGGNAEVAYAPEGSVDPTPGYTPGYDVGPSGKMAPAPAPVTPEPPKPEPVAAKPPRPAQPDTVKFEAPKPPPTVAEPAAAAVQADDPFGGLDPMAWLDALAKRQGANPDELLTGGNIEVPYAPEGSVDLTPGYTPGYDVGPSGKQATTPAQVETPPVAAAPVPPTASADDPFEGLDPMTWLEALAKRQGANSDELITGGNAQIAPPPPANSVQSGPGYSEYSPFGHQPLSDEIESLNMSQAEAERWLGLSPSSQPIEANPLEDMDPIKWLESLASSEPTPAPTSQELSIFTESAAEQSEAMEAETALNWLEQLARESGDLPPPVEDDVTEDWLTPVVGATMTAPEPVDEAGGLSDDPQEIMRWLNRQTEGLATVHEIEDPDAVTNVSAADFFDTESLAPSELPDWLRDQLTVSDSQSSALSNQIVEPPVPSELPDWLVASTDGQQTGDDSFNDDFLLPETEAPQTFQSNTLPELSTAEINAIVLPSGEVDPWAEALDEEFERKRAGDVSVPDWFTEALERFPGGDIPQAVPVAPEPAVSAGVLVEGDMPSWLSALEPPALPNDAPPSAPLPGDIPDWLREADPSSAQPVAEARPAPDDWMTGGTEDADLPDWLQISTSVPATPVPAAPVPPPTPAARPTLEVTLEPGISAPPPPTRMDIAIQRRPPPAQPTYNAPKPDLLGSLQTARDLITQGAHLDSLPHFQPLIDAGHDLESVVTELAKVVNAQPKSPRARRLLGDAYMRRGDLQEALDTYRGALDQL